MKLIYILSEAVTIEVKGVNPERVLNELSVKGVEFTSLSKPDQFTCRFVVLDRHITILAEIANRTGLETFIIRKRGLLHFLKRFRKRYVLISMPIILLLAVFYLSSFIWEIDVTGNKTVPSSVIVQALDEIGVGIGTNGMWLNNELIRSRALTKIKKLSWLTVQVNGSRALIVVRERRDKPELVNESIPSEILASKAGVIEKIVALAGKSTIKVGDTVLKGQTLITGELNDKQEQIRYVRSLGEVWARTWYEKTLEIPAEHIKKSYTGNERKQIAVKICNLRLNFYFNSGISYKYYDKITTENRPEIFGLALPFSIITYTYKEYEAVDTGIDVKRAEDLLKERLLQWVMKESGSSKLTDAQFATAVGEDRISVSVLAECSEQIGVTRFY